MTEMTDGIERYAPPETLGDYADISVRMWQNSVEVAGSCVEAIKGGDESLKESLGGIDVVERWETNSREKLAQFQTAAESTKIGEMEPIRVLLREHISDLNEAINANFHSGLASIAQALLEELNILRPLLKQ